MGKSENNSTGTTDADVGFLSAGFDEFDDWRQRYAEAIAAYDAMAERRRERKLLRWAQKKRDAALLAEDEIDRR